MRFRRPENTKRHQQKENMEYHADRDSYICRNGRELTVTNECRSKTASGYISVKLITGARLYRLSL